MRAAKAACPLCRHPSERVHSRYTRHLGDLPWQGRVGELHLQVRRFRCATADCPRRVFPERLPAVAAPRVRHTRRLAEAQRAVALSAGGKPGAHLSTRLAMPVSGGTLLRLIRAAPVEPAPPPRVIGIDDWAWRWGKRYGTIVVDLERNCPIDLLPDRQAGTVATWLIDHLSRRWDEGCHNAARLWREIRALGFTGQRSIVRDWAQPRRQAIRVAPSGAAVSWRTPSRRRAAWLVVADDEEIDATERAFVAALIAGAPTLTRTIEAGQAFRAMVRDKQGGDLDGWLAATDERPWPALPKASSAIWRRCVRG